MIKKLSSIGLAAFVLLIAQQGIASEPSITGHIEGLELCPQFRCDSAYFVGRFRGKVNKQTAKGGFIVSINHETLPDRGRFANITGGEWTLRANQRIFSGEVVSGTIFHNSDNTFTVEAVLEVTSRGRGQIHVTGELDHNDFPPTISAQLSQRSSE
jgi:hypothetical protein